jgi:RNA polymerase sigma-70 factor (ECF subfamily)
VAEALRRVPDEFRAALVLADVEDLPYDEIAAILDVAVGTVKSRVHRGRVALARAMGLGGEPDPVSRPSEEKA